jgi:hypothetical protein
MILRYYNLSIERGGYEMNGITTSVGNMFSTGANPWAGEGHHPACAGHRAGDLLPGRHGGIGLPAATGGPMLSKEKESERVSTQSTSPECWG